MEQTIYLVLAVGGCTLMVIQIVMQVFGIMDEVDADGLDVDHDGGHGNWFFGFLSLKALVAFCGVFGLTGLSLLDTDLSMSLRLLYAVLAGAAGMVLVVYLMRLLHSLASSGTLVLDSAVGREGSVYLRVPGNKEGRGKITVDLQGRSVELPAMTDGEEIATGARVRITEVLGDETVKVTPA